jgi:hypothetical protein
MYEDVSSKGGIGIFKAEDRFALDKGDGGLVSIKSGGVAVSPDTLGWKLLAAKEKGSGSGYEVYIKQDESGQYAKWELDDNGSIVDGKYLSGSDLLDEEDSADIDLNDDSHNGRMYEDVSSKGGIGIFKAEDRFALDKGDGGLVSIKSGGVAVSPDTLGWKLLAAKEKGSGSGYEVYIKQDESGQYAKWELDDNGSIVNGKYLSGSDLLDEEDSADIDLNDDSVIRDTMISDSTDDVNMKMLSSSVTWTLEPDFEHLTLTGDDNIDGTGNDRDNFIEGNAGNNILDGKDGLDILTGHEGADTFLFTSSKDFGPDLADHIIDFDPAEGDRIQVIRDAFGISKNAVATLAIAGSDSEISDAARTAALFIYDSGNGCLYLNQNGAGSGFGGGGLLAMLENSAPLSAANLALL